MKNQIHAILNQNLIPTCPTLGHVRRDRPALAVRQILPIDEWASVDALLRQLDFYGDELNPLERSLAVEAVEDPVGATADDDAGRRCDRRVVEPGGRG